MNREQLESIRFFCEDMRALTSLPHAIGDELETFIRHHSPILRRFVNDNELSNVWQLIGERRPLMIQYRDHSKLFPASGQTVDAALGSKNGNVGFFSVSHADLTSVDIPALARAEHERLMKACGGDLSNFNEAMKTSVKISKYFKSQAFVYNSQPYTIREVVLFVANKKGGAHHSSLAKERDPATQSRLLQLDSAYYDMQIEARSLVHNSIMVIIEDIVGSDDVVLLYKLAQACLGLSSPS